MTDTQNDWPTWTEPDEEVLAHLVRLGSLAADIHVIAAIGRGELGAAEQTKIAVQESLRMLLANGLITPSRIGEEFLVTLDRPTP